MDSFGKKQPSEAYKLAFDFTNVLVDGDTIASATITVIDIDSGADVTSTLTTVANQVISSPKVYFWIKAGTSGHNYKVTCVIVTSADPAETYELDARLPVIAI